MDRCPSARRTVSPHIRYPSWASSKFGSQSTSATKNTPANFSFLTVIHSDAPVYVSTIKPESMRDLSCHDNNIAAAWIALKSQMPLIIVPEIKRYVLEALQDGKGTTSPSCAGSSSIAIVS
jgi:hypothetical protein